MLGLGSAQGVAKPKGIKETHPRTFLGRGAGGENSARNPAIEMLAVIHRRKRWRASNPRRVGLHEMAMGVLGERGGSSQVAMQRPDVAGAAPGSMPGKCLHQPLAIRVRLKSLSGMLRAAERDATGERSVSLAKMALNGKRHVCSTAHILRAAPRGFSCSTFKCKERK